MKKENTQRNQKEILVNIFTSDFLYGDNKNCGGNKNKKGFFIYFQENLCFKIYVLFLLGFVMKQTETYVVIYISCWVLK